MVWLLAFLVMCLVVAGMSVGVMMGRKPIAGSCGGIGATGLDSSCSLCGGDTLKCEENSQQTRKEAKADLAYDATRSNK